MLVLVLLCVCFTAKAEKFNPLGRGIYLPDFNMFGNLTVNDTEVVLIPSKIPECSVSTKEPISSQLLHFYRGTKSFYASVTTSAGLDASLQADFTLGFTLDKTTKNITGSKRTVNGNSMLMMASTYQTRIYKDCLQGSGYLEQGFKDDLIKLPSKISQPWQKGAWSTYDAFLRKYGSHVVSSITYGSSINQLAFADSSESYSERDFQVKSCISLAGSDDVSLIQSLGLEMCNGVEQSEIDKVITMTMSNNLVVRGGTQETRQELLNHRTAELIERFLDEANTLNATIDYAYTSVWDLVQLTYAGVDQDMFLRGLSMEYYYLGYLNYDCEYQESGGQQLQKFDFIQNSSPEFPQYECSLAPQSCHSDGDCHYKPIYCSCQGLSCVRYSDTVLDTGDVKKTAYVNTEETLKGNGCDWKPWHAGSKCICRWPSSTRTTVWSRENKALIFLISDRASRSIKVKKDEL